MPTLVFLFTLVNIFLIENNCAGEVYNLVSVGSTFSGNDFESFDEVSLRDERQCISICTYNTRCRAFDALPVSHGIECRFFDFIMDYFVDRNGSLEKKDGVKLYSMKFPIKTCQDWYNAGYKNSGSYTVLLPGQQSRSVYCFMDSKGDGWMAFQRRFDGSVDFHNKLWNDYKNGFGNGFGEYWLGNDILHKVTNSGSYDLFVIAKSFDGQVQKKRFKGFKIGSEASKYVFHYESIYPGYSTYELFTRNLDNKFSTPDQDNDPSPYDCADIFNGGWWFSLCHRDHMNGPYYHSELCENAKGLHWFSWLGHLKSLKETILLIKEQA